MLIKPTTQIETDKIYRHIETDENGKADIN
jgi:hypothetical protein